MFRLARLALTLAAVAVTAAVVVSVAAQPQPAAETAKTDDRFEVQITGEMIRHSRIRDVLYFVGNGWAMLTMLVLLVTPVSRKIRDAAARVTKKPFLMAMLYIAIFTVVVALIDFPLSYYSGYVVPHQFDLSDQTFGAWLTDELKGLGVGLIIGSIIGALALLTLRRFKRWWIVLWIGSIPLILLMVVIQPVVLDPLFNKFEPLRNAQLRAKLLDLASRAGIEGGRVYQVDKSKQTKTLNAYVNGIGPTKRIVMWDTLLAEMTEDEVLAVMGHEMGHYVLRHMWKGLAFTLALAILVFFLGQKIHDRGLAKWGAKWGVTGPGDPASVPWLLLLMTIFAFLLSPVGSAFSRSMEHQSDMFSLELTHLNEPMASAFVKLAENSKRDPNPHPFIKFWRYSHPPIAERIPFALSYKPWEKGEPNRAWKP
jgi:STE24 endopeptidase